MYIPYYIHFEPVFPTSLFIHTGYTQTWKDALVLAIDGSTITKAIKNNGSIVTSFNMIICFSCLPRKGDKIRSEKVTEIKELMNLTLASCMNIIQKIVDSQLCITILLFFYPMFFSGIIGETDSPTLIILVHKSVIQQIHCGKV